MDREAGGENRISSETEQEKQGCNSDCPAFQVLKKLAEKDGQDLEPTGKEVPTLTLARRLLEAFAGGDLREAAEALDELYTAQQGELHKRATKMLRTLYQSLNKFRKNLDAASVTMNSTNVPDAARKIESVISLTSEAANKTLDVLERQNEVLAESRRGIEHWQKELTGVLGSLPALAVSEFSVFLEQENSRNDQLQKQNAEIMLAQEYQDLSGQALRKVLDLVTNLEIDITELVQVFYGEETPISEGAEEAEVGSNVDQGAVDDLLRQFD